MSSMWCNNCLLLFPLRGGALALSALVAAYSIGGGVILFLYGQYLWFAVNYSEASIYGGISMAVAAMAAIFFIGLSTGSYMWTRVVVFCLPIIIFVATVRSGLMLYQLDRNRDEIWWECNNGRQQWNATLADPSFGYQWHEGMVIEAPMPSIMCKCGFQPIFNVFVVGLLVDLVFQLYMWFLSWRYKRWLELLYTSMTAKLGGMYTAA